MMLTIWLKDIILFSVVKYFPGGCYTPRNFYVQEKPPDIARKTIKRLLKLAVGHMQFMCNDVWYTQEDGLAKGASLAVILANL